ncbi:MAG TPA: SidA/IucD/PvdA family monooxygenase [Stellaceae bacterium]|nr:SidA/IucD/PvdA family monooxygenase [Stellaceae bacterium]
MAQIAVVGGGPKAVAIAAKAYALNSMGFSAPGIVIYEKDYIGAAWSGLGGYTDGDQALCTPAERDLGYPYDRASYGPDVARFMFQRFSWHAFLVGRRARGSAYDDWVMHRRSPLAHRVFRDYLDAAAQLVIGSPRRPTGTERKTGIVDAIDFDDQKNQWTVTWTERSTGLQQTADHDGVVITGSGAPLQSLPGANRRVFDGEDFWRNLGLVVALLQNDRDPSVAIIGAGGTAAAVAYWFVRAGMRQIPITIVSREPTLFARHMHPFEDRLFTDSLAWNRLTDPAREQFANRVTRGIVSETVLRGLEAGNISYQSNIVSRFVPASSPSAPVANAPPVPSIPELDAELQDPEDPAVTIIEDFCRRNGYRPPPRPPAPPPRYLPATVFVDARGFNPWWFVGLLTNRSRQQHFASRSMVTANIDFTLSVGGQFPPGLHLPMLASRQGPAAPNLMALGWMSDRILRNYVTPPPRQFQGGGWNPLTE